jgi:hypothetical protein
MRIGKHLRKWLAGSRWFDFLRLSTSAKELQQFIYPLRPVTCCKDLIRVGYDNDGGYLVPDDLEGIAACFSPGVGDRAFFETDLLDRFNIPSYLADKSVDGPPNGLNPDGFSGGSFASE